MRPDPADRDGDGEEQGPVLNGAPADREGSIPNVEVSLSLNGRNGAVDSWSMPSGAVEYVRTDNGTIIMRILPPGVSSSAELGLGPLDPSESAGNDSEPQAPMTNGDDSIPHAPNAAVSEGHDVPAAVGTDHDVAAPARTLRSENINPTITEEGTTVTLKDAAPEEEGAVAKEEGKEGQNTPTPQKEEGNDMMREEEKDIKSQENEDIKSQEDESRVKNGSQKRACNTEEIEESCSKKAKI